MLDELLGESPGKLIEEYRYRCENLDELYALLLELKRLYHDLASRITKNEEDHSTIYHFYREGKLFCTLFVSTLSEE